MTGGWIAHLHGRPWHELDLPSRFHACRAVTEASLDYGNRRLERCPCGAWRVRYLGWDDWSEWHDRNSRRDGNDHSITIH